ncbi:uncharacterized protein VTP21DRAFT_4011 [Calcarisporiella thermophila]|uniref:uncharacterized protein n=1 Tax=Calcarisporiella thermophila TaxID=911321 RepID=UPI003742FEFC
MSGLGYSASAALSLDNLEKHIKKKNLSRMRTLIGLALISFLSLTTSPAKAAPLVTKGLVDKRTIGSGYPCYGGFPFFAYNQFCANAANVDDCFSHKANLAASVKADEATNAQDHCDSFNIANVNVVGHKRRSFIESPYYCGGGWGFPGFFHSAFQLNAANQNNRFCHEANLAANVAANEATTASNNANAFNTEAVNTVVMKRDAGCGGYGCDIPFCGYGGCNPFWGWEGYDPYCGIPYYGMGWLC